MTLEAILIAGLGLLVVAVAGFITHTRHSFAAVVAFVANGILLALLWMTLRAPDVALTEAAVGAGVTGALLLGAHARLKVSPIAPPTRMTRGFALGLSLLVSLGLILIVLSLPQMPPSQAVAANESLSATGLENPVTAVLMAFRSLDTLMEKVVLLLAFVGIGALSPVMPRVPLARETHGPLIFLTRMLLPVGILIGIHLFWIGTVEPGGAFAGGAVLAAMGLLALRSGWIAVPRLNSFRVRIALVLGIVIFVGAGILGAMLGAGFLGYPEVWAKTIIVGIEIAMTASISITLGLLVAAPLEGRLRA